MWLLLRGVSCGVLSCSQFLLVVFSIVIASLGLYASRAFVCLFSMRSRLSVFLFSSSCCHGLAAAFYCGTPWTFRLTHICIVDSSILAFYCIIIFIISVLNVFYHKTLLIHSYNNLWIPVSSSNNLDQIIKIEEIYKTISKLKNNKAVGLDSVSNEMLKAAQSSLGSCLLKLFNAYQVVNILHSGLMVTLPLYINQMIRQIPQITEAYMYQSRVL